MSGTIGYEELRAATVRQVARMLPGGDPLAGGEDNNLGFYPPAQALVVKAPSRITGRFRPPYPSGVGGGGPPGKLKKLICVA